MLRQCLVILSAAAATTTAQTACQDEASCRSAAALLPDEPLFRVVATQAKGCFEKGGTVYWSAGGSEEENEKPVSGQKVRVYCDWIVEDDLADTTTTTTAAATESAVSNALDDVSEETTASSTVTATMVAATTTVGVTEGTAADGDAVNTPLELGVSEDVERTPTGRPVTLAALPTVSPSPDPAVGAGASEDVERTPTGRPVILADSPTVSPSPDPAVGAGASEDVERTPTGRPVNLADSPTVSSTPESDEISVEAVIVGAGWAGISAAIDLQNSGYSSLLILEANDYVGGRSKSNNSDGTFNAPPVDLPSNNVPIELGSEWLYQNGLQYSYLKLGGFLSNVNTGKYR